jgi:hypothetical protein
MPKLMPQAYLMVAFERSGQMWSFRRKCCRRCSLCVLTCIGADLSVLFVEKRAEEFRQLG